MNNDDLFFNSLADFRDLKAPKNESDVSISQSSSSNIMNDYANEFNNNDKLIKSFQELR